ncbi:MAG: hypothetical protein LC785_11270 [Acidobacteria bacterium]|nr:hypothetical protein [Acidobacteriota bacterium]
MIIPRGRGQARESPQPRLSREFFLRARRLTQIAITASALLIFFAPRFGSTPFFATGAAQTRARRSPTAPRRTARGTSARDYSRFSHASASHSKRDCASFHRIVSFEQPDLKDYPDHPSCVECHRRQFFKGARPAICSNCHTVVSPRGAARFEFPKPGGASEFADVFPHANHVKTTSLIQFKKVIGEKANTQASCLYCHKVDAAKRAAPPQAGGANAFAPPAGTFMTTPTSHATCFQCHWREGVDNREQPPLANECARCHRNVAASALAVAKPAKSLAYPPVANADALLRLMLTNPTASLRAGFPPRRAAAKFVHDLEAHKKKSNEEGKEVAITCLQCHAAARKAATLESFRLKENRAGLPTCSSSACHTAISGMAQLKLSVYRELRERGRDAKFDCALCHTPPASLAVEIPCSHYAAVLAGATKEGKGTKGIEQITPPRCAVEPPKGAP